MDCPVCKTSGIDDNASKCPNCGSDLTMFRYLDNIRRNWKAQRRNVNLLAVVLLLFVIGVAGGMIYWQDSIQSSQNTNSEEINQLRDEVERLKNEKDNLMRTIIELRSGGNNQRGSGSPETSEDEKPATVEQTDRQPQTERQQQQEQWSIHVVKPGETLFSIAREEYGNGHKYKKIMEDNNLTSSSITAGQRLKIEK
ncbi:MAG: LysM peptidoglycan-binding domain-containing protein [Bacteroidales bacterium]|nr:LysM peptidoglycan-binding domain-containing protein [Bacteroidales bacterium]